MLNSSQSPSLKPKISARTDASSHGSDSDTDGETDDNVYPSKGDGQKNQRFVVSLM